jgi:hypothetical protein
MAIWETPGGLLGTVIIHFRKFAASAGTGKIISADSERFGDAVSVTNAFRKSAAAAGRILIAPNAGV